MRLLVTGGCGFIGSNFLRYVLDHYKPALVTNVDALIYAGNLQNVEGFAREFGERYEFYEADIANPAQIDALMLKHRFYAVINFAAEAHVDRSINSPQNFIHTNVIGTSALLESARKHGVKRFIQSSTGKVYGSICRGAFTEDSMLAPSSPYAASKAAGDLLALSYWRSYGFETIVMRAANNFGPFQHWENFIPDCVRRAVVGEPIEVFGDGKFVRDWVHVDDYCSAIVAALLDGSPGEIYHASAGWELSMLEIVEKVLEVTGKPKELLQHVPARDDLDARFALDAAKLRTKLGWQPIHTSPAALERTIQWYGERVPEAGR